MSMQSSSWQMFSMFSRHLRDTRRRCISCPTDTSSKMSLLISSGKTLVDGTYYGSTSLQLHQVTFSKNKAFLGVFRLLWNLFLAVTSWHYIVIVIFSAPASKSFTNSSTDHHHHHQQQEFYPNFKQKPLYAISFLLVQLLLPLAIILHVVYFAVLSIFSSPSLLYANSQPEFNGPFRFGLLRYYLAYYVIQQHNLIIMGLLHYYKNATLGALQALFAITTDKDNGDLKVLVDTVEPVICQLATLNRKLNGYLYFPLIVSTVMQLYANLIIFSTAVINGRFQFVQLLYILFFSVHFAYIATLQYPIYHFNLGLLKQWSNVIIFKKCQSTMENKDNKLETLPNSDSDKPELLFDSKSLLENIRQQSRAYFEADLQKEIENAKMETQKGIQKEINKKMLETEKQMKDFWTHLEQSVLHSHIDVAFEQISSNLEVANMRIFESELQKTPFKNAEAAKTPQGGKQSTTPKKSNPVVVKMHSKSSKTLIIDPEDENSNFPTLFSAKNAEKEAKPPLDQSFHSTGPVSSSSARRPFTLQQLNPVSVNLTVQQLSSNEENVPSSSVSSSPPVTVPSSEYSLPDIYTSKFSISLHPVSFSQSHPQNRAIFLWNIFYAIFSWFYVLSVVDPDTVKERSKMMQDTYAAFHKKPLFNIVFRFGLATIFPIGNFATIQHFYLASLKQFPLLKHLYSFDFVVSKRVFLVIIALDHLLFIAMYRVFFAFYNFDPTTLNGVLLCALIYLSFYVMNCNTNIIFGLSLLYNQLRRLSKLNRVLNDFLASPTVVVVAIGIFNLVSIFSQAFVISQMYIDNLFFVSQFLLLLLSLAVLQDLIKVELRSIETTLEGHYCLKTSAFKPFKVASLFDLDYLVNDTGNSVSAADKVSEDTRLKAVTLVAVYRGFFKLKLYELIDFDYSFLLFAIFFVINYTVLVIQTTKNAFLRLLFWYYGNFSLQLRPVSLRKRKSLFNLTWNVFAIFLGVYCIASRAYTGQQTEHQLMNTFAHRPLFTLAFNVFLKSILPLAFIFNVAYFIFLSLNNDRDWQLITLLDQFSLNLPSQKTFFIILLFDHLIFVNTYFYFITTSTGTFRGDDWSTFLVNSIGFIVFGAVFYYKYATLVSLQKIAQQLKNLQFVNSLPIKFNHVESTVKKLSFLNSRLNHILSLPLIIILFAHIFNSLVLLARVFVSGIIFYRNAVYIIFNTVILFCLGFFQKQIQCRLTKLEIVLKLPKTETPNLKNFQLKALALITVHRNQFDLSLFQLCSIDMNFFLCTVLFISNYVFLIVQTMHIKNQFLRWFVYYFNICSVPLLPVCFRFGHRGQGRLLFTWNLFAIATSLYFIFALMMPQALQAIRRRGDALFGNSSQKPLFTLFFRLGVTFALPYGLLQQLPLL
ncbi:hypothetical protein TYRP_010210 [Tyrophagus putrescentiae]|nr:hypothetical protein TYRP_010210 [Tyrophagus putrescentiae]